MIEYYIHYHEYDYNKDSPILVLTSSDGSISGFSLSDDGSKILDKVCICEARYSGECCCTYDWERDK
jgi:hypothetical protein